jgi:hypothetical protein
MTGCQPVELVTSTQQAGGLLHTRRIIVLTRFIRHVHNPVSVISPRLFAEKGLTRIAVLAQLIRRRK